MGGLEPQGRTAMSIEEQRHMQQPGEPAPRVLLPVTPTQERCWFLDSMRPGTSSLNVPVRWEIRGHFPAPAIEQALKTIIDRHEILRTRFIEVDGSPQQEVLASVPFKLAVVDLTMLPEDRRMEQMHAIGAREAAAPFNLREAPLIRATLTRMEEDRAFLMLVIHQSAFDGWSIRVLGRELGAIGMAILNGRPHNLPELPLQYGDYALWRQECLASGAIAAEEKYWKRKLDGMPYFELVPDHDRPAERTINSDMVSIELPYEFGIELEDAAKRAGVSFFNFGAAVVAALLHRYTGKTDIGVGTQFAGREDVDLESLIGVFINNIVLRNDLSGDPRFSELVARTSQLVREALENQNLPFHRLVELMRPKRDLSRTPLISVNVILQKAFMEDMHYEQFEICGRPSHTAGALYDFSFQMVGRPAGWRMTIEYNSDLFDRSTLEALIGHWRDVMVAVVADPNLRLSQLLPGLTPRSTAPKLVRVSAMEAALKTHADVADAVAVAPPKTTQAPYAYVTPTPSTLLPLETLPALLALHLADRGQAPPRGISVLMALPRLPNGDVDLAALPQPAARAVLTHHVEQRPASDIEAKLIPIWRDLLGVPSIDRNSHFFDLGGHSLLAVRMVTQASAIFGGKIDVLALFRAPTLGQFAEHIALIDTKAEDWKIVPIQPRGARTPIIAINNTILYYSLAKSLGDDQPFIGVQNYRPDADAPDEARSLEEIAGDYVNLIRAAQPTGPYTLIGLCLGGAIAYETAQQLARDGETPPTVIMFDCWAPGYVQSQPPLRRIGQRIASWAHLQKARIATWREKNMSTKDFFLRYKFVQRFCRIAVRLGWMKEMPAREFMWRPGFEGYLTRARSAYRPKPYAGDVLIMRSEEFPSGPLFDRNFGWRDLVKGRLVVRDIKGGHLTMCQGDRAIDVAHKIEEFLRDGGR